MKDKSFREAWPADGIGKYKRISDGNWGYLMLVGNEFRFSLQERPSDQEILERWGHYLTDQDRSEGLEGKG